MEVQEQLEEPEEMLMPHILMELMEQMVELQVLKSQPVVVEVYQKGFAYHDKLLRPALTKVAVPVVAPAPAPAAPEA